MKSIHFCTPQKIKEIQSQQQFQTIRTGFVPTYHKNDVIRVFSRITSVLGAKKINTDTFCCYARVFSVLPFRFSEIKDEPYCQEEIARYNKKFHDEDWFFIIHLIKL